jgi:hypothetical protein
MPKTVLEAQSQSKYLKRRLRRHHSSSLESIIQAIKCFKKGISIVLHELALLKARIKYFKEANKILSRRRRAKGTRLQKGGTMIVEEVSQVIDQMDINTQVVTESSRSGGQGRSARPGIRRCGVCGKAGHNTRTCQVVIETSGEEYSK